MGEGNNASDQRGWLGIVLRGLDKRTERIEDRLVCIEPSLMTRLTAVEKCVAVNRVKMTLLGLAAGSVPVLTTAVVYGIYYLVNGRGP